MSSNHDRRLRDLEVIWRRPDPSPGLHVTTPWSWPAEVTAAYCLASSRGDDATIAALVREHDGVEIGPRTKLIVVEQRPDGPQ